LREIFPLLLILFSISLSGQEEKQVSDTLHIKSDKTEYEITIIENGFNQWMASNARPRGFYSQIYLENYNKRYVTLWNSWATQGRNSDLFPFLIPYEFHIDYGYEVNYMLFQYFQFIHFKNPDLFPNIRRN
jgi:hypothetical protein